MENELLETMRALLNVVYDYEEISESSEGTLAGAGWNPAMLSQLSRKLVEELRDATVSGNKKLLDKLILQVGQTLRRRSLRTGSAGPCRPVRIRCSDASAGGSMRPIRDPSLPNPGNIMIVDDNPANLKLLEDMLRQHGYEVRAFPRGRLALAAAIHTPPDLILLDINMPEMNGYDVCDQLKSNPRVAEVPVIFLSALNAIEHKVKGFRSGGVDFISKPFQFEEVQARVEIHLQLRRSQRALSVTCSKKPWAARWEVCGRWSSLRCSRWRCVRARFAILCGGLPGAWRSRDSWQYELAATLCLAELHRSARRSFRKSLLRPGAFSG